MNIYHCKKTKERIVIDGNIQKPQWRDIEEISLVDTVTGNKPQQDTRVRLAWDDEFLYAAFECEDRYIKATMTEYNDPLYEEEVVEIFIDDDCDLKTYIEVEVNPLNTLLHYGIHNNLKGSFLKFARTDKVVDTAVVVSEDEKKWKVEIAIPFSELIIAPNIPPKSGDRWRMNFYRIDRGQFGEDEYSAWKPTGVVNFHMPEKFGEIVFVE
ncbi:MAG: carbohydrate-binding family 9-like protein [Clostridia bacterium]|nr:carbohydrate-binding family 9-like protein [Clostridia bacterium]